MATADDAITKALAALASDKEREDVLRVFWDRYRARRTKQDAGKG